MRLKIATALLSLFMGVFTLEVTAQWMLLTPFPDEARDDGVVLSFENEVFLGTGLSAGFATLGNFARFSDTAMQPKWTPVSSLPPNEERQYAASWTHGNWGYVLGGIQGTTFLNDLWRFNTIDGTWDTLSPMPGDGRSGASTFVLDNNAYVVGGLTQNGHAINEVWTYNFLTDTWSQQANLPFGERWRSSSTQIDTTAYLIFGRDSAGIYHNGFFQFTAHRGWTALPPFPGSGKSHACLVPIKNRLYTFGGSDSTGVFSDELWYFDTGSGQWIFESNFPSIGRRGGFAFSLNEAFYYSAGLMENLSRTKETWRYIPSFGILESPSHKLYLFPTATDFHIVIAPETRLEQVLIVDPLGRVVTSLRDFDTSQPIDVSHLAAGIYFVICQRNKSQSEVLRFAKG